MFLKNPTTWFLIGAIIIIVLCANWVGLLPKINLQPAQASLATSNDYVPSAVPAEQSKGVGVFAGRENGHQLTPTPNNGELSMDWSKKWGQTGTYINRVESGEQIYAQPADTLGMAFGLRGMKLIEIPGADGKYHNADNGELQYRGDTKRGNAEFAFRAGPGRYMMENPYDRSTVFLIEVG